MLLLEQHCTGSLDHGMCVGVRFTKSEGGDAAGTDVCLYSSLLRLLACLSDIHLLNRYSYLSTRISCGYNRLGRWSLGHDVDLFVRSILDNCLHYLSITIYNRRHVLHVVLLWARIRNERSTRWCGNAQSYGLGYVLPPRVHCFRFTIDRPPWHDKSGLRVPHKAVWGRWQVKLMFQVLWLLHSMLPLVPWQLRKVYHKERPDLDFSSQHQLLWRCMGVVLLDDQARWPIQLVNFNWLDDDAYWQGHYRGFLFLLDNPHYRLRVSWGPTAFHSSSNHCSRRLRCRLSLPFYLLFLMHCYSSLLPCWRRHWRKC